MDTVTVRLTDGPADGRLLELPAEPDGLPPARWVLADQRPSGPGAEHLYARGPRPDDDGRWTMRWVRTDLVGMTE